MSSMDRFLKYFSSIQDYKYKNLDDQQETFLRKETSQFNTEDSLLDYNAKAYEYIYEEGVIVSLTNRNLELDNIKALDILNYIAEEGVEHRSILTRLDIDKLRRILPDGIDFNSINSIIKQGYKELFDKIDKSKTLVRIDLNNKEQNPELFKVAKNIQVILPHAKYNESIKEILSSQVKIIRDYYAEETIRGIGIKL